MKVKMASAPTPGLIMGKTMVVKVFSSPPPSMRAASRISPGMPSANCFIRNTPKGQPTTGKITDQRVLVRCRPSISRSRGMRITCLGRAMAHTIRENSTARPMNRFLARAYPARAAVPQVSTMAATDMNTVLMSQRKAAADLGISQALLSHYENGIREPGLAFVNHSLRGTWSSHRGALRLLNSSLKLRMVHSLGHHSGVELLTEAGVLNAPVRIQYRGKRKMTAATTIIRIKVMVR